ncbi:MAG TPA: ribosome small subunit-dependent GTPase A [Longilinea sp.]|nr:ribosome small subunit-dependent GTPase A [Longilinea sp.]
MKPQTFSGWVIKLQSGFYTVQSAEGVFVCSLRGRLKRTKVLGDFIAVGDNVEISRLSEGQGVIEDIQPRKTVLARVAPTPRGNYQQVLLANPDQVGLVFACAQPEPHLRMLDRFLVITEKQNLPVFIVANKVDLTGMDEAQRIFGVYPPLGYQVLYTCARTGQGVSELETMLKGKITALAGPSGVGKSSLLNSIQPNLGAAVREVSESTGRGKHTTNVREMFPLVEGGFVADLPGLRSLALWDTEPEELDGYFPELRDLVAACQFNDCTHRDEPGCAVRKAVQAGSVSPERYESYLRLRYGEDNYSSSL